MSEIVIRDFDSLTDEAFVIDSWMRSFYANSNFTCWVPRKEFQLRHLPLINRLIRESTVRLAVEEEDQSVIIGYAVYGRDALHYVYVKENFRRFGICDRLLKECDPLPTRVTHLTERGKTLVQRLGLIHSPYFEP